jgi:hypothetical protein
MNRFLLRTLETLLVVTAASGGYALDDPVESGREALHRWWDYPWYDSTTDDVRTIDARTPTVRTGGFGSGEGLNVFVWGAIALTLLLLVALLIRAYFWDAPPTVSVNRQRGNATGTLIERAEALPIAVDLSKVDLLAEAKRLSQQGDYSRAVVFLYSHFLVRLDQGHKIRLAVGKTNRQYLRELASASTRRMLETVMLAFEDAFFGKHRLARERFEACWAQLEPLNAALAEGAA